MDPAQAEPRALDAPEFVDGLGERTLVADAASGDTVEILNLRLGLTSVPSFEFALRERTARLANFRQTAFARVRRVDRTPAGLSIVSDHVPGFRLSQMLGVADDRRLTVDTNAALCLIGQLLPAIVLLHENARDVAHGALGPDRLLVTPHARLVIAEYVLGSALEQLQLSHDRLWRDYRIPMPPSAGAPRFDHRADVMQIGVTSLALLLGRPLRDDEFARLSDLLAESTETSAGGARQPLSQGLRGWLARALQIDQRRPFQTARDAQTAFEQILTGDGRYVASTIAVEAFISRCVDAIIEVQTSDDPVEPSAPVTAVSREAAPAAVSSPAAPVPALTHHAAPDVSPTPPAPNVAPPAPAVLVAEETEGVPVDPETALRALLERIDRDEPAAPIAPVDPIVAIAGLETIGPVDPPKPIAPAAPPAAKDRRTEPREPIEAPPQIESKIRVEPAVRPESRAPVESFEPLEPIESPVRSESLFGASEPAPSTSRRVPAIIAVLAIVIAAGAFGAKKFFFTGAPPVETGTLVVQSSPAGIDVFVDGVAKGVTPTRLTLNAGAHILELRGKGLPRVMPITLAAGATMSQFVEFAEAVTSTTGQLDVRSDPPGATITIDGQSAGTAPSLVQNLAPGEHRVVLEREGLTVQHTVTIQAGVTATLVAPLGSASAGPSSGWVSVSAPFALQIFEDGRLVGTSETDRIMVPAGRHSFDLVNDTLGYRVTRVVQVQPGKTATVGIELPNGIANLNALPWAEVWIDNRRIGETPIGNLSLPIGPHEVIFRHPEFGEKRQAISVTPSAPVRLSIDMRK